MERWALLPLRNPQIPLPFPGRGSPSHLPTPPRPSAISLPLQGPLPSPLCPYVFSTGPLALQGALLSARPRAFGGGDRRPGEQLPVRKCVEGQAQVLLQYVVLPPPEFGGETRVHLFSVGAEQSWKVAVY